MDPQTMKFAMEQMSRMNPEQLQAMMKNAPANMSPDMMNAAMAQMKNMRAEDWDRAKEEMGRMDPDTIARQAQMAQSQMAGRAQYVLNASNQLKQEGNQLHGRGAYAEAVLKYERAKANMAEFSSKEARDLARACTLNLSSCYLNLKQYDKCVEQCNEVLSGEADSLKALYRRGQAHMGRGSWLEASADLERALRLAKETDPSQTQPIRDKLQEAKDQVSALRAAGKLPAAVSSTAQVEAAPASSEAASPSTSGRSGSETTVAASGAAATSGSSSPSPAAPASSASMPMPDPEMLARATDMMRSNPDMLKQAQEMMKGMSDEQLRGMARQMGVDVAPEVLRAGMGRDADMDPDMLAKMARLQAELPPDLRGPDAATHPETMKRLAEHMAKNPSMAATMGEMLSKMDPAKLSDMARAAGMPAGVTITPEMARMAAESLQRMTPQEAQEAVETAARMAPSALASSTAAASSAPSGREISSAGASTSGRSDAGGLPPMAMDPKAAADMLAAMSPDQLESITRMMPGGQNMQLTPEMAKMAAEMLKNMSPEDMARMQSMATNMQGSGAAPGAGGAGSSGSVAPVMGAGMPGMPPGGFTPEMMKMASDMMANMSPEDMAQMHSMAATMQGGGAGGASASGSGAAGMGAGMPGMPPGGLTPDMMKMASEMMKNMKPEDMASMRDAAAKMGMGGAAGGGLGAGPGGMPTGSMTSMMSDPAMMESMVRMMKSMDPEAMITMLMSSGMVKDRKAAEAAAKQMSNLSESHLKMMVRTAAVGQQAVAWVRRNILAIVAIGVLLLALLLRWLGWM